MGIRFSVVVPVWHEEIAAPALVRQIRSLTGGAECEVIVVDGDPDGSTLGHLDSGGVIGITAPRGRALQMNAGAARARGEIVAFVHADTVLPDTFFPDMERIIAGGAVAGAFGLRFDSPRRIYRVMSWFVSARSRLNHEPYGDQAIFMRRGYFRSIGGYASIPIMEDVEIVRRIRRAGARLAIAPSAVTTSPRRMEAHGVLRQVLRNAGLVLLYNVGVSPRTLSRWYTDDHRSGEGEPRGVVLADPTDST